MDSPSEKNYANPQLTEDLVGELEKIKGDAIGNTLYSERWVLKVLMKLTKFSEEDWNDDFESDLCSLWDMTLEKDVVNLLMRHGILTIAAVVLRSSSNKRLIEIMVGILGNMCCVEAARHELAKKYDTLDALLRLFDDPDSLILIQLVRLLNATAWDLVQESMSSPHWLETLITDSALLANLFSFILKSSTNDELLTCVLEFLNTMCTLELNDKDYSHYFCTHEMILGMLDAWQQLFGNWSYEEGFPNKQLTKVAEQWTAILCSFTGHEQGREILCRSGDNIGDVLYKIIHRPIDCLDVTLTSAVNLLDCLLTVYFNGSILKQLLAVLNLLYQNSGEMSNDTSQVSDNLDAVLQDSIENYCANVSISVSRRTLNLLLAECSENHVLLFWKSVSDRQVDDPGERVI